MEITEKDINEFLDKYSEIKKTGIKCNADASIDFYEDVLFNVEEKLLNQLALMIINVDNLHKINGQGYFNEKGLEVMLDDIVDLKAELSVYYELNKLISGLYTKPEEYDCWVGYIMGEEVFYVEERKKKAAEEMYL